MKSAIKANGNGVVGTPVEWVENWVIFVARWRIAFEYSFRICSPKNCCPPSYFTLQT